MGRQILRLRAVRISFYNFTNYSTNISGNINLHVSGDADDYESPLTFPDSCGKRLFWIVMLPMTLLFLVTIPDCRRHGCWKRLFMLTFFNSILWIAGLSYLMVWMVTIVGQLIKISWAIRVTWFSIRNQKKLKRFRGPNLYFRSMEILILKAPTSRKSIV